MPINHQTPNQFIRDRVAQEFRQLHRNIPKRGSRKKKVEKTQKVVEQFRLEFPQIDMRPVDQAIARLAEEITSHAEFHNEIQTAIQKLEARQRQRRRNANLVVLMAA